MDRPRPDPEYTVRYELLMEASNEALLIVDERGGVIDANHVAASMYGYSHEELVSTSIEALFVPRDDGLALRSMLGAGIGGRLQTALRRKDGSQVAVELSTRGAATECGSMVLLTVRDLSRKRRDRLRRLIREIGISPHRSGGPDLSQVWLGDWQAPAAPAERTVAGEWTVDCHRSESERERRTQAQWRERIRSAIEQDGLVLHYQPVVRLSDNGVAFWEALLRMKSSADELLLPGAFLPHAFRCGLTPQLDLWVVETVLRTLAVNHDLRVATNLSVQTIQAPHALAAVERAVTHWHPAPGQLVFEIAETAAVSDLRRINDWMDRMKRHGCRFALDDFGTGASSIEHLRAMAIDLVKVDGSYVQQMLDDPSSLVFVEAINRMCRSMGIEVIAECVESAAVAERLKQVGVALGQGYLWGHPAPWFHPFG